jgi:hypothetical protein
MEPERKIEKLLRAFAKKRRADAGAPLELHPATRRILQGEVSRRTPSQRSEGNFFLKVFGGLRSRLVYAACAVAVVLAGVMVLLPVLRRTKTETLAEMSVRNEPLHRAAQPAVATATPAPTAPAVEPPTTRSMSGVSGEMGGGGGGGVSDNVEKKPPVTHVAGSHVDMLSDKEAENRTVALSDGITTKLARTMTNAVRSFGGINGASGSNLNRTTAVSRNATLATRAEVPAGAEGMANKIALKPEPPAQPPALAANDSIALNLGVTNYFKDISKTKVAKSDAFVPQQFYRNQPLTDRKALSATVPVLANFQVQQNGREMRVVDEDGSVYSGYVQTDVTDMQKQPALDMVPSASSPAMPAAPSAGFQAGAAHASIAKRQQLAPTGQTPALYGGNAGTNQAALQAAQNYSFRVAGTNRSLNQNVIFTGNLLAITNQAPFMQQSNFTVANGDVMQVVPAGQLPSQLPLFNSRISGKAVIDDHREIEINAVPATR